MQQIVPAQSACPPGGRPCLQRRLCCRTHGWLNSAPMDTRRIARIGISLGQIGALHDGLGEFSLQIGQRVAAQAAAWQAQHGIRFDFHLRAKLFGLFGPDVGYLPVTRWQRYRHVQPERYALWHSLHQHNKSLPPQGCGPRVVTVHDLNHLYAAPSWRGWRQQRRALALMRRISNSSRRCWRQLDQVLSP